MSESSSQVTQLSGLPRKSLTYLADIILQWKSHVLDSVNAHTMSHLIRISTGFWLSRPDHSGILIFLMPGNLVSIVRRLAMTKA
ncbi:hypothetical protein M8J76_006278 [Diaphorina citri]|nr:hypothetical protein M8J75_003030 [Diaphorina citri]KAI5723452.1 hypothetical protein M8J76_006278 [Diaphorina citri]